MNQEELIKYELPWYAGYVSNSFLQDIIARHIAAKVSRKYARYLRIKQLEKLKIEK